MAERMPAAIWIGGKVTVTQAADLAETIVHQQVSLEWGDWPFQPQEATDLLDARSERDGAMVLSLCDDQACGGRLDLLEDFLTTEGIPFRRYSDGKYEYDPELAEYRPDLGWSSVKSWIANHSGEAVIPVSYLRPVVDLLKQAFRDCEHGEWLSLRHSAYIELMQRLPPETPPLPALEIETRE